MVELYQIKKILTPTLVILKGLNLSIQINKNMVKPLISHLQRHLKIKNYIVYQNNGTKYLYQFECICSLNKCNAQLKNIGTALTEKFHYL